MFVAKNKANQLIRAEQASTLEVYYCQSCKEKVRLSNEPFKVFKHKRGSKCNKNIQKLSLWHYLMDQRLKELLVDKVMFTNRHPFEHTKKIKQSGFILKKAKTNSQETQTIYVLDCLNHTFYESNKPNVIQVSEILKDQSLESKEKEYYWGLMPSYLRKKTVSEETILYLHVSLNYFIQVKAFGAYNSLIGVGVSINEFLETFKLKEISHTDFSLCIKKTSRDFKERPDYQGTYNENQEALMGCD